MILTLSNGMVWGLGFNAKEERGRSMNIFSIFKKDGNVWLGINSREGR